MDSILTKIRDTNSSIEDLRLLIEKGQRTASEYYKTGNLSEAETICRNILKISPTYPPSLHMLGIIACKMQNYDHSIALIKKSLEYEPKNPVAHFNLGLAFTENDQLELALSHYCKATQFEPSFTNAHVQIGQTLKMLNRTDEAFNSCYKALKYIPKDKPYFPFFGLVGHPERHLWMMLTISLLEKQNRPISILEVGSWLGSSLLTWDQSISAFHPNGGNILCVDHWRPHFESGDLQDDEEFYRYANVYSSKGLSYKIFCHNSRTTTSKVKHWRGPSKKILPKLETGTFDLVYIDGSHYYDDVVRDIRESCRLVRDGGYICGDDLEIQWANANQDLTTKFKNKDYINDRLRGPYHPGVTMAVHETLGKVTCRDGFWVVQKFGNNLNTIDFSGNMTLFTPSHFSEEWIDRFNNYAKLFNKN